MGIEDLRKHYGHAALREQDIDPDPLRQFARWLDEALAANLGEPNAMTLATANAEGRVSARMVLLKGFGPEGFAFYTNYGSRKAQDLAENPQAALVFYWDLLERQVRIEGTVEKMSREESEAYFRTRPRGSQLSAWASPQSRTLDGLEELVARAEEARKRFEGREIPLPDRWGGYRLRPLAVELWQGRPDRLHDRFRYTLEGAAWRVVRLAP